MSWSIGYSHTYKRDIGYGVVAYGDHPKCNAVIDRGLSCVCGDEHGGDDENKGCGLYFCEAHLIGFSPQRCPKCARYDHKPYKPKPDHPNWIKHKLTDKSWQQWRDENPAEVATMNLAVKALKK